MRRSQPWRTNRARVLRSQPVSAEARMWSALRNRQLAGLKFVRQAPVGRYFVDFLCREHNVIVEIDGATHSSETEIADDRLRSVEISQLGYRVFRVTNREVFDNIDGVLDALLVFIEERD